MSVKSIEALDYLKKESMLLSHNSKNLIEKINILTMKAKAMADEADMLVNDISIISRELSVLALRKHNIAEQSKILLDDVLLDSSKSSNTQFVEKKIYTSAIVNVSNLVGVVHQIEMRQIKIKDFIISVLNKFGYNVDKIKKCAIVINGLDYSIKNTNMITTEMIEMAVKMNKIHIINYL